MYDESKAQHLSPAYRLPALHPTADEVRAAMESVVSYNWADELADFNEHPDEGHIYLQLRVLHAHLYGNAH